MLWRGRSAVLLIALGCVLGIGGFLGVTMAGGGPSPAIFRGGVTLIGLGRGMFIVGGLALVMALVDKNHAGLFLGLWGITQALAQGCGTIAGGLTRDIVQQLSSDVALGYSVVYIGSLSLLALAAGLLVVLRFGRMVRSGAMRSPWAGLDQVNADQIIF